MPGFGPQLGAEFLAATGGDLAVFTSPDRLAGIAGLAPVPRDSGRISGNFKRPRRYDRRLLPRGPGRRPLRSRLEDLLRAEKTEGKRHTQALLALARRWLNVLWAMLRDRTNYQARTPATTPA